MIDYYHLSPWRRSGPWSRSPLPLAFPLLIRGHQPEPLLLGLPGRPLLSLQPLLLQPPVIISMTIMSV